MMRKKLKCGLFTILAITASTQAQGQTLPDLVPLPDILKVSDTENDTFIDLGGAILTRPAYLGSDKQDTNVLPYINAEYKGRFFVSPFLGAGVYAVNTRKLKLSAGAYFTPNRNPGDTPFTSELFDLDSGVMVRSSAQYFFRYGFIGAFGDLPLSGDMDGAQVTFRTGTLFPVSDQFRIGPTLQTTYSTKGWNNSLYGLTAEQALAANTPALEYSDGFTSAGMSIAAFYDLPKDFTIVGLASYEEVLGDIKDSPLTPENSGITATLGIAKRF